MGLDPPTLDLVESYIGGCGFVQDDLHRLADEVFKRGSGVTTCTVYEVGDRSPNDYYKTMFALTQNALNFMLTQDETGGAGFGFIGMFPRTSQIIRLSQKADLVGALLDFDLSIVGCGYDGNGVKVTPRSAYSLVTLCQVVTPFTLEERRNLQRISKVCAKEQRCFAW